MKDTAEIAAKIITAARELHGGLAFDYRIGIEGVARYGELYQLTSMTSNETLPPIRTGDGDEVLEDRKRRADKLWKAIEPEIQAYAAYCRNGDYRGWSNQSSQPLRRIGDRIPVDRIDRRGADGHLKTFNVTGGRDDGSLVLSRWDAVHSETCTCPSPLVGEALLGALGRDAVYEVDIYDGDDLTEQSKRPDAHSLNGMLLSFTRGWYVFGTPGEFTASKGDRSYMFRLVMWEWDLGAARTRKG
ncbi:hypothetical protein ABT282_07120 [Streptomyces sp. NPDC000927]|uniref:hypothetical protein n=1 Tax=Streptomyces sp. NPDC000927 TaxID=3154371 RepID=UPI00332A11FE